MVLARQKLVKTIEFSRHILTGVLVQNINIRKQIASQLREAIVSGKFKIGDRLPTEDDLARRFQVFSPTVREALKRLAPQNLVPAKRGPAGGNFVVQPGYEELAESLSASATLRVGVGA